jgi:hypothetical protein
MNVTSILVSISSVSFMIYGISYFKSTRMKNEFRRFGLGNVGLFVVILEMLGALGLLVGLKINSILLLSAGGLALLMCVGIAFRIRFRDTLWLTLPALTLMLLNGFLFFTSLYP